jgi:hypothetical protein
MAIPTLHIGSLPMVFQTPSLIISHFLCLCPFFYVSVLLSLTLETLVAQRNPQTAG